MRFVNEFIQEKQQPSLETCCFKPVSGYLSVMYAYFFRIQGYLGARSVARVAKLKTKESV